jgi:hypothetical protein
MTTKLYHGGNLAVETIDLKKCQPGRDFGTGFYTSKILAIATAWATAKAQAAGGKPTITKYTCTPLANWDNSLKKQSFHQYDMKWLEFILLNRTNPHVANKHDFDIVEGPMADKEVEEEIQKHLRGTTTKNELLKLIQWKKPSQQTCFLTLPSLQLLTPTHYTLVPTAEKIKALLSTETSLDRLAFQKTYTETKMELAKGNTLSWTPFHQTPRNTPEPPKEITTEIGI